MIEDIEIEWFVWGMRQEGHGFQTSSEPLWKLRYRLIVDGVPQEWRVLEQVSTQPHDHSISQPITR